MNLHPKIEDSIREEARDWLTRLYADTPDATTREEFRAWINKGPEHLQAYKSAEMIWRNLGDATAAAQLEVPQTRSSLFGWFTGLFKGYALPVGALASVLLAAFVAMQFTLFSAEETLSFETGLAERRDIQLADGSSIMLGAKSRLTFTAAAGARRAVLQAGEAFFDVAKDAERPFSVQAGDTAIHVVGTRFDVKHGYQAVHVAVLDGAVDVGKSAGQNAASRRVTAGERLVSLPGAALPEAEKIAAHYAGAWRTGQLTYKGASLSEIIADANRYYGREIRLASAELASIRLTTAFSTTQVETMLAMLEKSQPVIIDRSSEDAIVIRFK